MSEQPIARAWIVRGRVQKVGFRAFTAEMARRCDVTGWVANHRDGSVHVAAAGPRDALRQLEASLLRGPAMARVDALEEVPVRYEEWVNFEIRATL